MGDIIKAALISPLLLIAALGLIAVYWALPVACLYALSWVASYLVFGETLAATIASLILTAILAAGWTLLLYEMLTGKV